MKVLLLWSALALPFFSFAQKDSGYDASLANRLGADAYGMKQYVLVLLKTGSNGTEDTALRQRLFRGHMDNMGRLVKEGKLVVAGPLKKNEKNYRGIFILNAQSLEEARALLATDPAVKEGIFDAELYEWYGSAALPEYLPLHDKIKKNKM